MNTYQPLAYLICRLIVILFVLSLSVNSSVAQMTGPSSVHPFSITSQVEIYQLNMGTTAVSKPKWSISGGTIDQQSNPIPSTTTYKVGVKWNTPAGNSAPGSVEFQYENSNGTFVVTYNVTIYQVPLAPVSTISIVYNCGTTTVTRNSNPPNSITNWFWETASGGTVTSLGSQASITISSPTSLYLRARSNISPSPWGGELSLGNISVSSTIPASPTVAHPASTYPNAGSFTISVDPVAGATSYNWYTSSTGGSPIAGQNTNVFTVQSLSTTTTYYASAMLGPCESGRLAVQATVIPIPTNPSLFNISPALVYDPSLNNTYWYSFDMTNYTVDHLSWNVSNGQILSKGNSGSIYYALIKWTSSGPGSVTMNNDFGPPGGFTIAVPTFNLNDPVNVQLATTNYNCKSTIVNRNSSPASYETWYWQVNPGSDNSSNTDTSLGSGTSVSLTSSPSNLYIRRKWNIYPYPWGASLNLGSFFVYTVIPDPPSVGHEGSDFQNNGLITLSVEPVPGATQYSWYTQDSGGDALSDQTTTSVTLSGLQASAAYYVSSWIGPCESLSRFPVMANVSPNYIITNLVQKGGVTFSTQVPTLDVSSNTKSISYFDGIGRVMQNVSFQGSPQMNDINQPVIYDSYGRMSRNYLQVSSGTNGWFKTGLLNSNMDFMPSLNYGNGASDAIEDDTRPYSETFFEPSPLSRPQQSFGPGQYWKDANKYVGHGYGSNNANEVLLFSYDSSTGLLTFGVTSQPTYYVQGQLHLNISTDEQGSEVLEYINKLGQTVCKKVQYQTDAQGVKQYTSTYYVYDDLGNLVVVVPPEAVKKILSQN